MGLIISNLLSLNSPIWIFDKCNPLHLPIGWPFDELHSHGLPTCSSNVNVRHRYANVSKPPGISVTIVVAFEFRVRLSTPVMSELDRLRNK